MGGYVHSGPSLNSEDPSHSHACLQTIRGLIPTKNLLPTLNYVVSSYLVHKLVRKMTVEYV
ncbi:protein of unknown function [Candidatus Nitrosotalea okcheonensis]|uniref:Uncharacterized protein n=1 Tax=Candidatus Nitrosotalea okcheonensis TaxID=1903276 RepID=A0A2H1FHG7_9ARCH|nr:protein of unknown function [Candidatus Nitrosotalea okcheonensis]